MNFYKIVFYLSLIVMLPTLAMAQAAEPTLNEQPEEVQRRDFDKKQWQDITKNMRFDTEKERKLNAPKNNNPPPALSFGGNAAFVMKILIGILLTVLLFFIIRSLLGLSNPRNKKVSAVLSVEELEQLEAHLHQADLENFIQRAIEQGNFSLATRLYYLAILKELSLRGRIDWKKDKTNRDYLRELRSAPAFFNIFSDLTILFERIWYGNINLSYADFQQIEPKFRSLLQKITATSTVLTP